MNKRILTICLALALCLSLIPAAAFAEAPLYTYQEIATGIKATDISMMDNGYGSFKVYDDDGVLVSKGVVSPAGKAVLTRVPGPNEPHGETVDASTIYDAAGSVIADLLPVYDGPAETMMGADYDFNLYGTDGKLITSAKKIIASYEKMSADDIICNMTAYFGRDGYLTVFAYLDGVNVYAYIIDPQTQKVVLKQWCYEDTPRAGGESWNITSVNDGLIAYNHGESKVTDAGFYDYGYVTAGWMDINGRHKVSVNTEKYNNWWNFSSGLAMVYSPSGFYGYVDKNGKEVIPCTFKDGSMFKDGYAYVNDKDFRVGYIDTKGETVIPFQYEYAYGYGEGLFVVGHAGQNDNYYGMVDINNTQVVPITYTDMSIAKNGIAYAIKDGEIVILKFAENEIDPNAVENIFKDVPGNAWYLKFLQKAYDSKIVGGKKDKTGAAIYDPNGTLTHAEIMVMVANLHSTMKDDNFQSKPVPGDHWAASFRDYCKAEGIIDARFDEGLNVPVTRAEMAYYFARALDVEYYKDKMDISFTDMPENGYDEYIMRLAKADIVGGVGGGKYAPGDNVTRAQASVFVSNILDAIAEGAAADSRR